MLGGILPPWRQGRIFDIDLVASEQQAREIATAHGAPFRPHAPGCVYFERFDICFDDNAERWALLDRLCPPAKDIELVGKPLSVRVAPPEVLWAARAYTVGLSPKAFAKGVKDAAYFDSLDLTLSDDHKRLAIVYRSIGVASALAIAQRD